jgi:hypothetical protein
MEQHQTNLAQERRRKTEQTSRLERDHLKDDFEFAAQVRILDTCTHVCPACMTVENAQP